MKLKSPLDVQIEVTSSCNYSCRYCYNPFEHLANSMDKGQIERVVEQLSSNDVFSYIFTGGEPFMNRQVLLHGLNLAQEKNADTYINTNLSLPITIEDLSVLTKVKNVLFSIPSSDPIKYRKVTQSNGWDSLMSNLEYLSSNGVVLTANQVVFEENLKELEQTASFLSSTFGIRNYCATPVNPSGCSRQQYTFPTNGYGPLATSLKRIRDNLEIKVEILTCLPACVFPEEFRHEEFIGKSCSAGRSTAAIGADGHVRKCVETSKSYGNIFEESLKEIWERIVSDKPHKNSRCNGCFGDVGCSVGCEARAINNAGFDPVISNVLSSSVNNISSSLKEGVGYRTKTIKFREENSGRYIATDGGSFIIEGNLSFIKFLKKLEEKPFTLKEISERFGFRGVGLLNYLNERGVIVLNGKY